MRSERSPRARARSARPAFCRMRCALVARELRLVGLGDGEGARARRPRWPWARCRPPRRCTGCGPRSRARVATVAADAHRSWRIRPSRSATRVQAGAFATIAGELRREVEGVEVAPAARRIERRRRAVDDQRHALLGDAAMRAQRRVEAATGRGATRWCRSRRAFARHDDQVADAVGRQLEALRGLVRASARPRCRGSVEQLRAIVALACSPDSRPSRTSRARRGARRTDR